MRHTKTDPKAYLEYLDKEMTIMGILSAISIAAPAGILNAVFGSKDGLGSALWNASEHFLAIGSVFGILAAFLFYNQRSTLAWFYGQICLTTAIGKDDTDDAEINDWLWEADSWESWWTYSWGFDALVACFAEYSLALAWYMFPSFAKLSWVAKGMTPVTALAALGLIGFALLQRHVLYKYKFSGEPWCDFRDSLSKRLLPHDNVYTRLMQSHISGVGVFAIRDIPKGTSVFEPDDDPLVSVEKEKLEGLPVSIAKLYKDFCVLEGSTYRCPKSFNNLTPSWFLNRSSNPNVGADRSLKFHALRDIKLGEELLADYSSYSDNEPRD